MKRKLALLLAVLLCVSCLAGCTGSNLLAMLPLQEKEDSGEVVAGPVPEKMTAQDLYGKLRYAVSTKNVNVYTMDTCVDMMIAPFGIPVKGDLVNSMQVHKSADPYGVNVLTTAISRYMNQEQITEAADYYRREDGKLICYSCVESMDYYERREVDALPSEILSYYDIGSYMVIDPEELWLEENMVMLDGREMYVLCYSLTGLQQFGMTGDKQMDAALHELQMPVRFFVDAETFVPARREILLEDAEAFTRILLEYTVGSDYAHDLEFMDISVREFKIVFHSFTYGEIEVPLIPKSVLDGCYGAQGNVGL